MSVVLVILLKEDAEEVDDDAIILYRSAFTFFSAVPS